MKRRSFLQLCSTAAVVSSVPVLASGLGGIKKDTAKIELHFYTDKLTNDITLRFGDSNKNISEIFVSPLSGDNLTLVRSGGSAYFFKRSETSKGGILISKMEYGEVSNIRHWPPMSSGYDGLIGEIPLLILIRVLGHIDTPVIIYGIDRAYLACRTEEEKSSLTKAISNLSENVLLIANHSNVSTVPLSLFYKSSIITIDNVTAKDIQTV